jgi:D-3-phosphoglycerate dehydrogenase
MFNIITLNKIASCGISQLPDTQFRLSDEKERASVPNPDGILLRSFTMGEADLTPGLLAVARAGAGVNNIPVEICAQKGIVVFNTPGANANAVKELVLAGLLLASRRITDGINWAQSLAGKGDVAKLVEKGKGDFAGPEIAGKQLGVVGLGAIGGWVANMGRSLGMNVIGFDPYLSVDAAWSLSRGVQRAVSEDALYADCDYITVHAPANDETKYKFNAAFFAKCKKGVRILNFSRAELFDNAALKEAIADGTVACYVTDFPTDDLLGCDKVIPIPHLGASTPESEDNCAIMAAMELREYLLYGNIKNSVNFPDCELPYIGKQRICLIHKNVVNVMASVSTLLGEKGINIDNMINRSKGAYAYTMIDVDNNGSGLSEALSELDAMIKVRVI